MIEEYQKEEKGKELINYVIRFTQFFISFARIWFWFSSVSTFDFNHLLDFDPRFESAG